MARNDLNVLAAFAAVARDKSFTRAAIGLSISPSALSHAIKGLEARLGVRLLTRTTRSVSATEAGKRLMRTLDPALDEIESALADVVEMRSRPSGSVRITAVKHAILTVLLPILPSFCASYPDVSVEVVADDTITDVVAAEFDAGIRLGERVDRDMIAIRISGEIPTALVATPDYFSRHSPPASPRDLARHDCIGHRMGTGGRHSWPFVENDRPFSVKVDGALTFNDADLILAVALRGQGLAYLFADQVAPYLASGQLIETLADWSMTFSGYYFYYPNRRHQPPALAVLIETLRKAAYSSC